MCTVRTARSTSVPMTRLFATALVDRLSPGASSLDCADMLCCKRVRHVCSRIVASVKHCPDCYEIHCCEVHCGCVYMYV